jgi:hypothetical protein
MADLRLRNNEWLLENIPDADNLGWETIDLGDGSWTQSDPSGIILNTASTVSEITKVTFNAVGTGNLDYDLTSGTNFTGPRWYTNLRTSDSIKINSDDPYIIMFEIVVEPPTTKDKVQISIGVAEDPTSTVRGTILFSGQVLEYVSTTGNPRMGPVVVNANTIQNVNNKIGFSTFASITARLGNVSAFNLDSSSGLLNETSVTANRVYTSSTDLFLVVQAGIDSTNTISACDIQAKLRYRVIRISEFPL